MFASITHYAPARSPVYLLVIDRKERAQFTEADRKERAQFTEADRKERAQFTPPHAREKTCVFCILPVLEDG